VSVLKDQLWKEPRSMQVIPQEFFPAYDVQQITFYILSMLSCGFPSFSF